MAKPRAILKRKKAVQNTAKITKTMQMIATAKFKRAADRAAAARPYTDQLTSLIAELSGAAGSFDHPLLDAREPKNIAVVALSSNRGLCGGYNSNIVRATNRFRAETAERGLPLQLHVAGKKLAIALRFQGIEPNAVYTQFEDKPRFADVNEIASRLMAEYEAGEIDELYVIYTKFLSTARQRAVVEKVLPLEPEVADEEASDRDYIYHPDATTILSDLLPRSVRLHVFQAFLDAAVSEQVSRMIAMTAATDAAKEMIRDLTMLYNRSRQTLITTELSEIIGGAAALE